MQKSMALGEPGGLGGSRGYEKEAGEWETEEEE